MQKVWIVVTALIWLQSLRTWPDQADQRPLGDVMDKALAKGSLLGDGARPFHIYVSVSEPGNPASPYQGTIEEWWASLRNGAASDGERRNAADHRGH